jgi:hypothetical protein
MCVTVAVVQTGPQFLFPFSCSLVLGFVFCVHCCIGGSDISIILL